MKTAQLGGVHIKPRDQEERGPKDLLRDEPPRDEKSGLNPAETVEALEDGMRGERAAQVMPGIFNHPRVSGADRCGAKYGRCLGDVVNGVCSQCGADYRRTTPLGGVNDPVMGVTNLR